MRAISSDMRRAALIRQDEAAHSRALHGQSNLGRTPLIMTQAAPDVRVSTATLQQLASEMATLYARFTLLVERETGADITGAQPTIAADAKVFNLADARARRQAVQR